MSFATACSQPKKCVLTFKLAEESGSVLVETEQTQKYTYTFEFDFGHTITQQEENEILATITKELPMPGGGYWSVGGYYSSLNKDVPKIIEKIEKDYVIYFTWVGGPASAPGEN